MGSCLSSDPAPRLPPIELKVKQKNPPSKPNSIETQNEEAQTFKQSQRNLVDRYITINYEDHIMYDDITEIIFQYYFIRRLILDSLILTDQNDIDILEDLLAPRFISVLKWHEFKLRLLYRKSADLLDTNIFHLYCDGNQNTLTLIKTAHGQVFGGFTTQDWGADNGYYKDDSAFLFRIKVASNFIKRGTRWENDVILAPKIYENKEKDDYAIYVNKSYGPTWGYEHDLFLHSGNDIMSSVNSGVTYEGIGNEICGGTATRHDKGRYFFNINEYEVFALE